MHNILPTTYFFGAIVLVSVLHFALPIFQLIHYPWRFLGLIPLIIGVVLNLAADQAFKKHNTTVKPFERSNVLVTSGVFGISRNPMYTGMMLILFGMAILLGTVFPFIIVAIMGVVFDRRFITLEERMLEEIFGDQFRQYCRCVRKWI